MSKHVRVEHEKGCDCIMCRGGLFECSICGGCEGEIPMDCPETKMTEAQKDGVMAGHLDYQRGKWINVLANIPRGGET